MNQMISNEILASVSKQTADSVLITDRDGIIQYVNPSFENLTGFSREEILGKTPAVLKSGAHTRDFYERLWRTILHGAAFKDVLINKKKDGTLYYTEKTITPIRTGSVITHFVSTDRDITEVTLTQQALKKKVEELARSNRDLEKFAYFASHDLQEPVRTVVSFLQLLKKKLGVLDPDAEEYLNFAVEGGKRMQDLILSLLSFSRAGQKVIFRTVDLNQTMEEVWISLSKVIEENHAQVMWDLLPKVKGDKTQLSQVLQNLVCNAIKYRSDKPPVVHIAASSQNGNWIFAVKDNGMGIDPEHHEKIFGLFTRLCSNSQQTGSGIGLALCQRVINNHGGSIWVKSELGRGTTIFFTIPKDLQ